MVATESVESVEHDNIGLKARGELTEMVEVVVVGCMHGRHHQRILHAHTRRHRQANTVVDVTLSCEQVGFAVIGTHRQASHTTFANERDECGQVLTGRALTDEHPHPLAPLLACLGQRRTLVVTLDTGGEIGIELTAHQSRGMTIDTPVTGERDLGPHLRVAMDHPGEVHHLGHPDRTDGIEQLLHLGGAERRPRALEPRGGNATRRRDPERERQPGCRLRQRSYPLDPEHVGDLMRVGGHRRRSVHEYRADELVDPELGRFEMHMGIDHPGDQGSSADIDRLDRIPRPPADHSAVTDRHLGLQPFASRGYEHRPSDDQQVGGLVSASCSESTEGNGWAGHPPISAHLRADVDTRHFGQCTPEQYRVSVMSWNAK